MEKFRLTVELTLSDVREWADRYGISEEEVPEDWKLYMAEYVRSVMQDMYHVRHSGMVTVSVTPEDPEDRNS